MCMHIHVCGHIHKNAKEQWKMWLKGENKSKSDLRKHHWSWHFPLLHIQQKNSNLFFTILDWKMYSGRSCDGTGASAACSPLSSRGKLSTRCCRYPLVTRNDSHCWNLSSAMMESKTDNASICKSMKVYDNEIVETCHSVTMLLRMTVHDNADNANHDSESTWTSKEACIFFFWWSCKSHILQHLVSYVSVFKFHHQ